MGKIRYVMEEAVLIVMFVLSGLFMMGAGLLWYFISRDNAGIS